MIEFFLSKKNKSPFSDVFFTLKIYTNLQGTSKSSVR